MLRKSNCQSQYDAAGGVAYISHPLKPPDSGDDTTYDATKAEGDFTLAANRWYLASGYRDACFADLEEFERDA